MKQKIINFLKDNRGSLALAVITFVFSLFGSALTDACGGGEAATAMAAPIAGQASLLCINYLCRYVGYQFTFSKDSGALGIIAATVMAIVIF